MEKREILAYAITHAPKGVKGGPYEGAGARAQTVPKLVLAYRYENAANAHPDAAWLRYRGCTVRVIRIVRKAQFEVGAAKESAAFERETWREASAVEVLREVVAWDDAPSEGQLEPTIHRARRVLAASGPDPSEVVRTAMAETEVEAEFFRAERMSEFLALPRQNLNEVREERRAAVAAYRKAGGK